MSEPQEIRVMSVDEIEGWGITGRDVVSQVYERLARYAADQTDEHGIQIALDKADLLIDSAVARFAIPGVGMVGVELPAGEKQRLRDQIKRLRNGLTPGSK